MESRHLNTQRPGMPETSDKPGLNDDLSLKLDHGDGHVVGPLSATMLVVEDLWEPPRASMCFRAIKSLKRVEISTYLTETRLAYVCANYGKWRARVNAPPLTTEATSGRIAAKRAEGAPLVGQVRFPWIKAWERRDNLLRLLAEEREPAHPPREPPYWPLRISLEFRNRDDAVALCDVLTRRIAAYRLADGVPKDESAVAELQALFGGAKAPQPPAGRIEDLYGFGYSPEFGIPGSLPWGLGLEYAPPRPPSQLLEGGG